MGRGWQLQRLAAVTDRIAGEIRARCDDPPLDVAWRWRERIDAVLRADDGSDTAEREARDEKAAALETIARRRISALVGPAALGQALFGRPDCTNVRGNPQNDKSPAPAGLPSIAGARFVVVGDGTRLASVERLPAPRARLRAAA